MTIFMSQSLNGKIAERLVYRGEESAFSRVEAGRVYGFGADGSVLKIASEAYRIRLAHLFDPYLAVTDQADHGQA